MPEPICEHGFIGACALCDGSGQVPEPEPEPSLTLTLAHFTRRQAGEQDGPCVGCLRIKRFYYHAPFRTRLAFQKTTHPPHSPWCAICLYNYGIIRD